jgi:WD40 repeat protein
MFVWRAHEGAVTALAFGPDGRFLVSAGADQCVRVWDPFTGTEQLRFALGQPGELWSAISGLVCSGDAGTIVVRQGQRGLAFLDAIGGSEILPRQWVLVLALKGHPDGRSVFAVVESGTTISSDGRSPVAAVQSGRAPSIVLMQLPFTGTAPLNSIPFHVLTDAQALAISPDGRTVVTGSRIHHWPPGPAPYYGYRRSVDLGRYAPSDYAFSADGRHLFALVRGKLVVYESGDGSFKTKLTGHNGRITALALAPDGRRLWTASHDATVKCWDTFALTLDRTYVFQTGALDCLAVSPDGNVGAVGSRQKGTITLWDLG